MYVGLGQRSRHSALLDALDISHADNIVLNNCMSLFRRICAIDSPTRDLCLHFTKLYIRDNTTVPGTLIHRLVNMGVSPTSILLDTGAIISSHTTADGIVDSLRAILYHDNYVKPWCNEYMLVKLLTRSF